MDECIISDWNEQVKNTDEVYILGDMFFYKATKAEYILSCLNGIKYLVLGNHDDVITKNKNLRDHFNWVKHYHEETIDGIKVCMMHYPIYEWNGMHRGSFHLYGHVHGKDLNLAGRAMDVGYDTRYDGNLWEWDEIKTKLLKEEVREHLTGKT
jgi:calcineurin-like phosphoesterase family protein